MKSNTRFIARVALFSALAYVLALISVHIPNVSLIFITIFTGGILLGFSGGLMVGGIGMFLWTVFNPFGMTSAPMTMAQIAGAIIIGVIGAAASKSKTTVQLRLGGWLIFAFYGLITVFIYQLIVSLTIAFLYGPFWPALISNLNFALIMIISNTVIFTACYPIVVRLKQREIKF
jgi:uncharacterized membrane protein